MTEMGAILLLRVEPEIEDLLRRGLRERGEVSFEALSADTLEARLAPDSPPASVLLLGPGVVDPIHVAQRAHAADDDLAVLVLCPPNGIVAMRAAIQLAPFLGVEVHCVALAEPAALLAEVAHAASATGQRRLYRAALAAVSDTLESSQPPPATAARFLDRLLEIAPIGILTLDAAGRVLDANDRALALFETNDHGLLGTSLAQRFPEAVRGEVRVWLLAGAGGDVASPARIWERRRHDGGRQFLEATARSIEEGAASLVLVLHDVTARLLTDEELARVHLRAEEATRAKSRFLANVSHEIRTPMNIIVGMVDMALDTEVTAQQREYLELARRSTESLLALVSDILDFSKIEAEKLELEAVGFGLRASLEPMLRSFAVRAEQKGLSLVTEISPAVPEDLIGDPSRLQQVMANLLGNAVKFTESGFVTARLTSETDATGAVLLRVAVTDTGIGIAEENLAAIFDPFEQADGSTTRLYGGTGLGLSICRRLVELMGGRLWAESRPGEGSTFSFTARLRRGPEPRLAAPAKSAEDAREADRHLRILVAEDNAANQLYVRRVLEKNGHSARIVATGQEALEALEADAFDVVLMDVQMPEMDGLQATSAIRAAERGTGRHLPIIAVTAHAMRGDEERCLAAGVDAYIAKPARPRELLALIERVVPPRGG
jgi:PAS domain S-box-containing protein